ncbi:hypothetical protein BX600DRAFT_463334, partial [Xylariales sp. PMI_506]
MPTFLGRVAAIVARCLAKLRTRLVRLNRHNGCAVGCITLSHHPATTSSPNVPHVSGPHEGKASVSNLKEEAKIKRFASWKPSL